MKLFRIAALALVTSSLSFVSCQTAGGGVGASGEKANGIQATDTGYTRERVYQWQDRTFRQLAY